MISDADIAQAMDRHARTSDGALLYRYLQRIVMFVPPLGGDESALREDLGRRRFAHDLMALMAKGIEESGGRHDTSTSATERLVVFSRGPGAQRAGRVVSARDFLRSDPEYTRIAAASPGGEPGSGV